MESTNLVVVLPFSVLSLRTFSLLILTSSEFEVNEIENTALYSGSSQQGKAILAAVGSNCVVAIHFCKPFESLKLLL